MDGGARVGIMAGKLLHARWQAPRLRRSREDMISRLDPLLGFEDTEKIQRAEFNNPFPITHDNAAQNG